MGLALDHIVLNVVDIEKMLRFYTGILQLPGERLAAFEDGKVPFPSVRLTADTIIDLFPKPLWEKSNPEPVCRPNLNHFCLVTERPAWHELQTRLREHNVAIDAGPVERWGAHGSGISIYFRDPEENVIEVRYYHTDEQDQPCLLGS
ncbi:MAG TPA: VOC family protein [Geopsychrobacteraceae bacterium]|jgi:catechol 2,3-dioxygenase-like lactoylglutathione lyase family enzyme